jgi:hypothetical protein
VHGAQPCAGQHRDDRLRHHRHVDHHAVTLADAEAAQHACEPGRHVKELAVGVGAFGVGDGGVVDQRGLIAASVGDVPVERVGAGVELPIGKPPIERGLESSRMRRGS